MCIDENDPEECTCEVPGGYQNEENFVEYFPLDPYPRAKEFRQKFDPNHSVNDLTVAEKAHFDEIYGEVKINLFFGQTPTRHRNWYSPIYHNIRANALHNLRCNGKIKLFGFDPTAALCSLKVSPKEEILIPATGTFVVVLEDGIEVVIDIEKCNNTVEWSVYCKNSIEYSKWDKLFRAAIKKYNQYKNKVFTQDGEFINLPPSTFDDIFLDDEIRAAVQTNIIDYTDPQKIALKKKNNIPVKRGVIFAGQPGTGKSFLSRVLANTLNTTFMVVTNLHSIVQLEEIFKFASQFDRVVLLFEDIDIYIQHRELGSALLPTMLNALDGMEENHLIVLCTTNNVEALDKAIKNRPGRFDTTLVFNAPSKELKKVMLKGFCTEKNIDGVDFEKIVARAPEEYTGAHLKELYISACTLAIENGSMDGDKVILTTDLFMDALYKMKRMAASERKIGFIGE